MRSFTNEGGAAQRQPRRALVVGISRSRSRRASQCYDAVTVKPAVPCRAGEGKRDETPALNHHVEQIYGPAVQRAFLVGNS